MQFGIKFLSLRWSYTSLSSKPSSCHDIICISLQKIKARPMDYGCVTFILSCEMTPTTVKNERESWKA